MSEGPTVPVTEPPFRKSSFSGSGNCVEVAPARDGMFAVRDSKNPLATHQLYTGDEWSAFLRGVKAGEFDFGLAANTSPSRTRPWSLPMRLFGRPRRA